MRHHQARGVLEHALAFVVELEFRRDRRGKLDQFVIEERHAGFQAPGHCHVVDALDRIVDQHDMRVEPQGPVDRGGGAFAQQMIADQRQADIAVGDPLVAQLRLQRFVGAIEEHLGIVAHHIVGIGQRRIPVVAAEHLVGRPARTAPP